MNDAAGHHGMILINALNLHKNTIHSLWRMSKEQNNLLKNKKYSRLFSSRHDKEALMQSMKKWANEIRYYYDHWKDLEDGMGEEERSHILSLIENISNLIENTLLIESENQALLEERRRELVRELGTIDFYQDCLYNALENRN